MKKRLLKIIKKNKMLFEFLLWIKILLKGVYYAFFLTIFKIFPVNNNVVMVINYSGQGYGDMGKYICNYIINNRLNLKIYWASIKKYKNTLPKEINYVTYDSIKYLYYLSTSHIWINNCRFPYGIIKRKKQFYIQTWHGGLGLKKIEREAYDLPKTYIISAKRDSKMANLMVSNCDYRTNQYKNNFWYNGKIAKIGLPRNDVFFQNTDVEKIKNRLNIKKTDKIILYVPTFRNYEYDYFQIDFNKLVNQLKLQKKVNYKILIRLHPNVAGKLKVKTNSNILDVSNYPDVYEIIKVSDILISDYSSIMFDYLYTKNPIYLFSPDYCKYSFNRGLNFNYMELPFSISNNSEELINKIINDDYKNYSKKLTIFLNDISLYDDGNASKKLCEIIQKIVKEGDLNEKI